MRASYGFVSKSLCSRIRGYCTGSRNVEGQSPVLHQIQCSIGSEQNYQVLLGLLKSCCALPGIKLGQSLHGYVVKHGYLLCQFVSKALLNMYAKCGALDDCQKLFDQTGKSDPVVWNILLSGFAASRKSDAKAIRLFSRMHTGTEPKPTPITIAIVLPVCARLKFLEYGKSVHSYVIKSGLETQTLVGNALISMYAKCGKVVDNAYAAFDSIEHKDVVSWNAIIAGFSDNKLMKYAFELFLQMLKGPVEPNYATIVNILPVSASLGTFGEEIHGYVLRRKELAEDISVLNSLVSYYLRSGKIAEAEVLFRRMKSRDLVSWNAIISGYASNCEWWKALDLFQEFLSSKMSGPDSVTLLSILSACAHTQNLQIGKQIHGYILCHSELHDDTALGNALVNFYAKCDDIQSAFWAFLMISKRDLISWNSILDAFAVKGHNTQFLILFHQMLREGMKPDSVTVLAIIQFCINMLRVDKVKETHSYSLKAGLLLGDTEPTIGNALIDGYAKSGNMDYANIIFQTMSEKKNLVTCNSMISGYVNSGSHNDAYSIFREMSETDLTTWNLMIRVCADNGNPAQALTLFHQLHAQGLKTDAMTIMSLLPVCSQMASEFLLRQCHGFVVRACFDDIRLNAAILDIYAKCGSIASASKLFYSSPSKDLVTFTAMVGGYAMHGMGEEALKVYFYMLESGVKPDHVIITSVLSACSHAGLVDEGLKLFNSIEKVYGMKPTMEQYACVVDLLARRGQINEAYSFVTGLPLEANANVWGTLLGACRTHHKVDLGRIVAERLFEVEAGNIGNYVVMSNLYAADSKWDEVLQIRKLMKTRDLKKPAGCSWIEVDGRNNIFIAGDTSHPERNNIYHILCTLDDHIKSKGSVCFF